MPFLHEGAVTRTVRDSALVLNVLAGYDPCDPFALPDKLDFLETLDRPLEHLKIAFSPNYDVFPVDPAVQTVVQRAVRIFEKAGATIDEVKLNIRQSQSELSDLWCRSIAPYTLRSLQNLAGKDVNVLQDHRDALSPGFLEWADKIKNLTLDEHFNDLEIRTEIYDNFQAIFSKYDLLIGPTLCCPPVNNATDGYTVGPVEIAGEAVNRCIGWCPTYLTNFTGHPSASIPAGLDENQLPVGLHIIGRRYADLDVLRASSTFERLQPWHQHYQICEQRALDNDS